MYAQQNEGLKKESEFDIKNTGIELTSLVAGFKGWGLAASSESQIDRSMLDTEGFKRLDRNAKLRRFRRWWEGSFVKLNRGDDSIPERRKLH
jgi:hypothetical protein